MAPSTDDKFIKDKQEISSIHARIKIFEHPFVTQINNPQVESFCSHCMRAAPQGQKLLKCAGCNFVRYCCKDCQRLAWKVHRPECRRLKTSFPNLPLTEVLFLSKIVDKVVFLKLNGDKFGWEKERKFSSLVDHKDDIRNDPEKMEHFEKIYTKTSAFRKEEMVSKDDFFDVFCKAAINSHSIHTNAGTEIGMALDLGISKYNHSCRPTCTIVFDGYRVCLRPLVIGVNASDLNEAFISYIDVGRSKYMRRKDLKTRWYFDCMCTRCADPEDDLLTAIKCSNSCCDEPLMTSEAEEPCSIACQKCKTVTEEAKVKEAQELMKFLPTRFDPNCPAEVIKDLLSKAENLLHPTNVYVSRLRTALMQLTGQLTVETISSMHKEIYSNYKMLEFWRPYYTEIKLCRTLILIFRIAICRKFDKNNRSPSDSDYKMSESEL
ncbi:hypothetical protein WR25_01987 isoform A [Diploscapter pachys]|uniref:MYND-type domain-containing protein n=1 Tax=Diploscapter pachys TaxID=2018661 RepID=A0A2A2L4G4_9BILA|nr:hypothetical protein WR25_01987 isoform A [Diploscapter pachys]